MSNRKENSVKNDTIYEILIELGLPEQVANDISIKEEKENDDGY